MKSSSSAFRPRLPLDPFLDLDLEQPWLIQPDIHPLAPSVVLVLGAPTQADLQPLLTSQFLSDSLVLIATHAPPRLPAQPQPTVLVLRLEAAPDELAAVQLVSIFERAGHLVQHWRTRKNFFGDGKIAQLAEKYPGGNFTQVEYYSAGLVVDEQATRPSAIRLHSSMRSNPRSLLKRKSVSSPSASTHSLPTPPRRQAKDYVHSNQRMFDAILNFLPASLPEKDILKHAILVTSLSVPFLTCALSHQAKARSTITDLSKRHFPSILRSRPRSSSRDSDIHRVPNACPAHLVHILPSPPTSASSTISPSASNSSLRLSSKAISRPASLPGCSSLRPPFLTRHPSPHSMQSPWSSSSTLFIPPSQSPTSTHMQHPYYQPISAPIHSTMGSQSSSLSLSTTSTSCNKQKLAQTIEQFLLSFAYPPRPVFPTPSNDLPQSKTVPYLLAPGILNSPVYMQGDSHDGERSEAETLVSEGRLTVVEAVILGLLDVCAKGDDVGKSLKSVSGLASRAWIGEMQPVVLIPKRGKEANDNVLSPSPVRLTPLTVPAPALSPSGREKERENSMIREDDSPTSTLTPNCLSPSQAESRSSSPHSDKSSIKRPAAVVPRMPGSLTPPLGMDVVSTMPALDHSSNPGLVPPDSCSSAEHSGGTEYESCETSYSMGIPGTQTAATSESKPGSYDPYHTSFLDHNWSRIDADYKDIGLLERNMATTIDTVAKKGIKGVLGHGFKSLTKAVSISALAASSMSSMAVTTSPSVLRRGMRRERDMLRPVVV